MIQWMAETAHRPWPLPSSPWVMRQTWNDVLFAHWPIPMETVRPLVPEVLDIDTYEGQTWLGVIPFRMNGIRVRGLPPLPFVRAFPEINVRVYVKAAGKPGVYFFSLDAANRLAVYSARWINLAYFYARMYVEGREETLHYHSERQDPRAPQGENALFKASYKAISEPYYAQQGTLEHWLTERYCLYTTNRHGRLSRGDIHHLPWPLQEAQAEIKQNTLAVAHGISLPPTPPLLHFSKNLDVVAWLPKRV